MQDISYGRRVIWQLMLVGTCAPTSVAADSAGVIVRRNIFCSRCQTEAGPTSGAGTDAALEPKRSRLPIQLVATLTGSLSHEPAYATIVYHKRTRVQEVGDRLMHDPDVRVLEIQSGRLLLANAGRVEFIDLASPPLERGETTRAPPVVSKANDLKRRAIEGVRQVSDSEWEIQREALAVILNNPMRFATGARLVPSFFKNRPTGFKLYAVRPSSIYSALGLKSGDTIHQLNGKALRSPDQLLALYRGLRGAHRVTIALSRRGRPITQDYVVR